MLVAEENKRKALLDIVYGLEVRLRPWCCGRVTRSDSSTHHEPKPGNACRQGLACRAHHTCTRFQVLGCAAELACLTLYMMYEKKVRALIDRVALTRWG